MYGMYERGLLPPPGYELHAWLGQGGFGKVWEASAPDGKRVALKFLPCSIRQGALVTNEIRRLLSFRELRHPHLIRLYNVFAGSNHLIVSMERADANLDDLHQAYQEENRTHIRPDELCDLLTQAAEALDFIASEKACGHDFTAARLQHCDIKPSNLLLVGDRLKVADFGLCAQQQSSSNRGGFRGTPPYAAPELYQGRISGRIDQYALAVTYCKLRVGELPFVVTDPYTDRHLAYAPDLSRLPDGERRVVARALELSWLDRWPSCTAFVTALRAGLGRQPLPFSVLPDYEPVVELGSRAG